MSSTLDSTQEGLYMGVEVMEVKYLSNTKYFYLVIPINDVQKEKSSTDIRSFCAFSEAQDACV